MAKVKRSAKQRTITTIVLMTLLALVIIIFYFYWSNRTAPLDESGEELLSETDRLLQEDLVLNYPETPRAVVKLFGSMMKSLYHNMEDEDIKAMSLKIRELYDEELLANNPQDEYVNNLYTDIAKWKERKRSITNFRLVKEDLEQQEEIDGVLYSINYIAFTIQENVKFTETWKVLLRQDEEGHWKILGWQIDKEQVTE